MTGSVAFWYEPLTSSSESPPTVELHFNLWRDLIVQGSNYLDIGFLFKDTDEPTSPENAQIAKKRDGLAATVDSFSVFLPGVFQPRQLSDLSALMDHGSTLNAVFNDVVTISEWHEDRFKTVVGGRPHLTFHKVDLSADVEIQAIEADADQLGTIFRFKRSFCERVTGQGDHYFRLRFVLDRHTRELFTSDTQPSDWFVGSSFVRTELTEFRLNERRSFPHAISQRACHFFDVRTVHYFLMRHLRFELTDAHTNFRKMRRLEADLWRHYLRGTPPGQDPGWRIRRALARGAAKDMLIYHWRVGPDKTFVEDFIAFARFRVPTQNFVVFAIIIGFLGGMGNAVYGIVVSAIHFLRSISQPADQPSIWTNFAAVGALIALTIAVPFVLKTAANIGIWLRDGAAELTARLRDRRR